METVTSGPADKSYKQKCYEGPVPRILVTRDFILQNNLRIARTNPEILAHVEESKNNPFDFWPEVLLPYLHLEQALTYYTEEYQDKLKKGETPFASVTTIEETAQDFLDYLVFGWGKALDQRGISASRTISKLSSWCWLMGRDDLVSILNDPNFYNPYGMPALIAVSEVMGIEVPQQCIEFAKIKANY